MLVVAQDARTLLSGDVMLQMDVGEVAPVRYGRHLPLGPHRIRSLESCVPEKNSTHDHISTQKQKQNVKQRQHSKDESREVLTFRIGIAPFPMTPTQFEAPPLEGSRVTHGAAAQQVRATLRQPPVPFLVVCILLQCNQYV